MHPGNVADPPHRAVVRHCLEVRDSESVTVVFGRKNRTTVQYCTVLFPCTFVPVARVLGEAVWADAMRRRTYVHVGIIRLRGGGDREEGEDSRKEMMVFFHVCFLFGFSVVSCYYVFRQLNSFASWRDM